MVAEDFEQEDKDMLCALQKLAFFPISLIMMALVSYYFGGLITAIMTTIMLGIILVIFELIEDGSG